MTVRRDEVLGDVASAYEGLEDSASFRDPAAVAAYRASLLERSAPQADFLAGWMSGPARVLELACGNGRLLVELARRGLVADGEGWDIAASRIAFARTWAADAGHDDLQFEAADLLARDAAPAAFDLALCITGALAYFEPAEDGLGLHVLRRLHDTLTPGGTVVLELYPHPSYRPLLAATGGHARIWHELDAGDPWRFYLSDLRLDGDVLTHAKTFVHRADGTIDEGRRERLLLYTPESLTDLLQEAGFTDVRTFEGWTEKEYAGGEILVATALRPSPR